MKTKAAVCRTFGKPLTVETIELAEPGPGEVLIKTAACAICHSDIFTSTAPGAANSGGLRPRGGGRGRGGGQRRQPAESPATMWSRR